jgi:response regulator RpfG family c-di-GMP phosphodiesterase/tRNA A-37 threonylcarbamoyl transferase component Bud32
MTARRTNPRISTSFAETRKRLPSSPAESLLRELILSAVILPEEWESLPEARRQELIRYHEFTPLLVELTAHGLITDYQAVHLAEGGDAHGLVLGNYCIRERLGAGATGTVYLAEQLQLRRRVAIKIVRNSYLPDAESQQRFASRLRAVVKLEHPNIVTVLDAGRCPVAEPGQSPCHFLVMEYVPGQDLEELITTRGSLSVPEACDVAYQLANALTEAHKHDVVHGDIKPSNVRLTNWGQVKLLDFGLGSNKPRYFTEPARAWSRIGFTAPELTEGADTADIRADIYAVGATLFWCLAGTAPIPAADGAPSVRSECPEAPAELDDVVRRMLAVLPAERPATPQAVMQALAPFLPAERCVHNLQLDTPPQQQPAPVSSSVGKFHQLLIVDDDPMIRGLCKAALPSDEFQCDEAPNGARALEILRQKNYDLVLLDVDMPEMMGQEVCRRLRKNPPCPHLKILMFSGLTSADELAHIMLAGADDFLNKPLSIIQLLARIKAALRLKDAQDRSDMLMRHVLAANHALEQDLTAHTIELVHARDALVLALAELVSYRDMETGGHLMRMQRYCQTLAREAAQSPGYGNLINSDFVDMLECCAPLHDIGKAGLPDHILRKPGKLTVDEFALMRTHTTIGADTLTKVAQRHRFAQAFLQMGIDIARHHHERYDGKGYPDGLAGDSIPLAARLVTLADVYDALRSRRVYKPALAHSVVMSMMTEEFPGHFDPALFEAFQRCGAAFERIFHEMAD